MNPAQRIINEVAAKMGVDPATVTSRSRTDRLVCVRIEVAHRLDARKYSSQRIGAVLNRDHSTVLYYLGRGKHKVSPRRHKPKWSRPVIKHLHCFCRHCTFPAPPPPKPPKPVKHYLVPYVGADMKEYEWIEREARS